MSFKYKYFIAIVTFIFSIVLKAKTRLYGAVVTHQTWCSKKVHLYILH